MAPLSLLSGNCKCLLVNIQVSPAAATAILQCRYWCRRGEIFMRGKAADFFFFPQKGISQKYSETRHLEGRIHGFMFHTGYFLMEGPYEWWTASFFSPLVLDTGVPHSHIMRQPQQGAVSVVGELTCRQRAEVTAPTTAKTWGEDSNLK